MFYFIRHPETTWNIEGRMQGSKEGNITQEAKKLAYELVKSLPIQKVTHIYYADNERTKYIADLLKKKHPEAIVVKDNRLNERDCGLFEGVPVKQIFSEDDQENNYKKRFYWKPPKGESHADVSRRVKDLVRFLKDRHGSSDIVCVTSSGVLRNLLRQVEGLSLKSMYSLKIPNLGFYKLNF
jgi:probable phosphoglycerate mutase